MKKLALVKHDLFFQHTNGPNHPECAERLISIFNTLEKTKLIDKAVSIDFGPATEEDITRVHTKAHFDRIKATAGKEHVKLDEDTATCPVSFDAAMMASGALISSLDHILSGDIDTAFAFARPAGHHAEKDKPMGFCLFNYVAVAAAHLIHKHKMDRVLVIDWDVHHGNGTQNIFFDDPRVLFFSIHQYPFYPGTGSLKELGYDKGLGYNVNVPIPSMYGDDDYLRIFHEILKPVIAQYKPQFTIVSAGFDAFFIDPLGGMRVTANGFAKFTRFVMEAAIEHSENKIAFALEGGYNLGELGNIAKEVVEEIIDINVSSTEFNKENTMCDHTIEEVKRVYSPYWDF